ncbi:MAG: type II secretion system protein [Candidatus Daviesbacteria bacterium]|nr:type II secretion system protein [Candidatus Daviesbacteria bacterium]
MKKGFTLIELLLYVSIIGVVILSIAGFLFILMQSRVKNQTIAEVEQQGIQVMQIITQTGRNAQAITLPAVGSSSASLTFDVVTVANDPTIFDLDNGVICIKEGTGSAVSLTNSRISASGLTFHNLSRTGTPGIIRIQFTLTHINSSGRNEYDFSKTFYGTASLR